MTKGRLLRAATAAAALLCLQAPTALAQLVQTYAAATGNDGNACSAPTAPCRTLAGALAKTIAGGKIFVLTSGDYQSLLINKSISIIAVGVDATLFTGDTTKITVAAGPDDVVNLDGLTLRRAVPASGNNSGVRFNSGRALQLRNCSIQGFGFAGVHIAADGPVDVFISDCTISDNAVGIWARATPNSGNINLHIERTALVRNSQFGLQTARRETRAWLSDSTITHNGTGLVAGSNSRIISYGNNVLLGNGVDTLPTHLEPLH